MVELCGPHFTIFQKQKISDIKNREHNQTIPEWRRFKRGAENGIYQGGLADQGVWVRGKRDHVRVMNNELLTVNCHKRGFYQGGLADQGV